MAFSVKFFNPPISIPTPTPAPNRGGPVAFFGGQVPIGVVKFQGLGIPFARKGFPESFPEMDSVIIKSNQTNKTCNPFILDSIVE